MSEYFLGQIALFSFDYPPPHWAQCDGQLLGINQNSALFALLGTTYGGNGQNNFGLPDLRGRAGLHQDPRPGRTYSLGQTGGEVAVMLSEQQLPQHVHYLSVNSSAEAKSNQNTPGPQLVLGRTVAEGGGNEININLYQQDPPKLVATQLGAAAGGGLPHENRQPFLAINFCICLSGIWPSRN